MNTPSDAATNQQNIQDAGLSVLGISPASSPQLVAHAAAGPDGAQAPTAPRKSPAPPFKPGDPFTQEVLNRIFTISPTHPDRLTSRESGWLEFKESFGFHSLGKYIRSAAGFANGRGGYIVFGIANRPHKLLGLKDNTFNDLDPEKLAEYFSQHFDPEIDWERHLYELGGKVFGLLYFHQSRIKPVICRKGTDDGKSLKEGEIYYRYNGRTQTIRYAELKELIEEGRRAEQLLWFKHLKEIARVGIADAAVFDLKSGKVSGSAGHFFIEEGLLPQLSFIRDGEFNERTGQPTLKVIGEAKLVGSLPANFSGKTHIVKTQGIRAADIVLRFLRSEKVFEPRSFLTQICYESTAFLPFYYILKQARLSLPRAAEIIRDEHSTSAAKGKLLSRIQDDSGLKLPLPSIANAAGQRKLRIREALLRKEFPANPDAQGIRDLLAMIRTLERRELATTFLRGLLEKLFTKHYGRDDSSINDDLRRAICYLDFMLNRSDVECLDKTPSKPKVDQEGQ